MPPTTARPGVVSRDRKESAVDNARCAYWFQEVCDYKGYRLRGEALEADWVKDLDVAEAMSCFEEQALEHPLKVLILYGSLRTTSYSRLLALEFARWDIAGHLV